VYIQYSVRSLVCRIHNTASNSVNSLRAGLGMFYMFGRTGAQDKRPTDQSYRKQRDILGLCVRRVFSKIFWNSSLSRNHPIKGPTRMVSRVPRCGSRRAWLRPTAIINLQRKSCRFFPSSKDEKEKSRWL